MEYCDSFLEQLHREEEYPYTGNHAADGILYHYMRLASRELERSGEAILSRKQKDRLGLGITSMRAICQNCGGSLELQWDDTHFTLMFLIPEKQQ